MSAYSDKVLADGPALYYTLDDTSSPIGDQTGSSNNATVSGTVGYNAATIVGPSDGRTCLNLIGVDPTPAYLDLGTYHPPTTVFSVEITVKVRVGYSTVAGALYIADDSPVEYNNGWAIYYHLGYTPPQLQFSVGDGTVDYVSFTDVASLTVSHHIVAVFNGATKTQTVYLDGVLAGSGVVAAPAMIQASGTDINIGRNVATNTYALGGYISHFAIYEKALTAAQALNHYQLSVGTDATTQADSSALLAKKIPKTATAAATLSATAKPTRLATGTLTKNLAATNTSAAILKSLGLAVTSPAASSLRATKSATTTSAARLAAAASTMATLTSPSATVLRATQANSRPAAGVLTATATVQPSSVLATLTASPILSRTSALTLKKTATVPTQNAVSVLAKNAAKTTTSAARLTGNLFVNVTTTAAAKLFVPIVPQPILRLGLFTGGF